ncbi:MAG: hypothetical protein ABIJ09_15640 [Pseudomonadota bacterium]
MSSTPEPALLSPITMLQHQWGPIIDNLARACQGDSAAREQTEPFLERLAAKEEWENLHRAVLRLLDGERDVTTLIHGLDATDTLIVGNALMRLGVDVMGQVPGLVDLAAPPPAAESRQDLDLGEFVGMVAYACRPNTPDEVRAQLDRACQAMASDPDAEPALRALGRALGELLAGRHDPDMSELPEELSDLVKKLFKTVLEGELDAPRA